MAVPRTAFPPPYAQQGAFICVPLAYVLAVSTLMGHQQVKTGLADVLTALKNGDSRSDDLHAELDAGFFKAYTAAKTTGLDLVHRLHRTRPEPLFSDAQHRCTITPVPDVANAVAQLEAVLAGETAIACVTVLFADGSAHTVAVGFDEDLYYYETNASPPQQNGPRSIPGGTLAGLPGHFGADALGDGLLVRLK